MKRLVSDRFSYQNAYLLNCESEEGEELAARATGAIARKKGITKDMMERREERGMTNDDTWANTMKSSVEGRLLAI